MIVSPGDVIHMDACGACKFPASKISQVLKNASELCRRETEKLKIFQDPNFSLAKWKAKNKINKQGKQKHKKIQNQNY
jgi:hypothetical protein